MATYREKLREKKRDEAGGWDDIDLGGSWMPPSTNNRRSSWPQEAAPAEGEEASRAHLPEMNKYLNKVEDVLDGMERPSEGAASMIWRHF